MKVQSVPSCTDKNLPVSRTDINRARTIKAVQVCFMPMKGLYHRYLRSHTIVYYLDRETYKSVDYDC